MTQYNPYFEPTGPPPKIRFSAIEVRHLAGAVVLLSLAFAAVLSQEELVRDPVAFLTEMATDPALLPGSFLAVASGFVLHELAHKIVAQRYGHWAEFRAKFSFLGLSLAVAMLAKILFAVPGAVLIRGRVTLRENGIISLVGPATNVLITLATFPFTFVLNPDEVVPRIFYTVAMVNVVLAVFNMLPFSVLDGRKVYRWNKPVYFVGMGICLSLLVVVFLRVRGFYGA